MNIIVRTMSDTAHTAILETPIGSFPCTLGSSGVISAAAKQEGDKKTPLGTYPFRYVLWREDRMPKPETGLPVRPLLPQTGWCEDPHHKDYNLEVTLPHDGTCDTMTRDDHLYDIVAVIGYNDDPVLPGKGSAIFMHLARHEGAGTAGCVGLALGDLRKVLEKLTPQSTITILPPA